MFTLALSSLGHDASVTLLENNKVIYSSPCERITRVKYDRDISLSCIGEIAKFTASIDLLVLVVSDERKSKAYQLYLKQCGITVRAIVAPQQTKSKHHLFHAAAGFYQSGMSEAAGLVIDAFGSGFLLDKDNDLRCSETTSFYNIKYPNDFTCLYKTLTIGAAARASKKPMKAPIYVTEHQRQMYIDKLQNQLGCFVDLVWFDIGLIYNAGTLAAGFRESESGKLMGMAGYGSSNDQLKIIQDGTILPNVFHNQKLMYRNEIVKRCKQDKLFREDLAYNTQKAFEILYLDKVKHILDITGKQSLILSGGCSLNILVNSLIVKSFPALDLHIDPIASDATISLGAAFYYYYELTKSTQRAEFNDLYLGLQPTYSIEQVRQLVMNENS